nr:hypothetical protein [Tanacetum cinerariifolium]
MEDPNIIMKEYIKLEEEKARKRDKVYNWETATYGRIQYDDDVHDLRFVETKFPAIVFNDKLTSVEALSCEPTVSPLNDNEIDFRITFDESDDEDYMTDKDNNDNEIDIIQSLEDMALPPIGQRNQYCRFKGLQYTDADIVDFKMRLGMLRDIVYLLVELGCRYLRFKARWYTSSLWISLVHLEEMETVGFGLYWAKSGRQIFDKGDLSAYWREISSKGGFLVTEERLQGLMVILRDLPVIDMVELVRLQIYEELDDTWDWVSPGPERQPDATAGAPKITKGDPDVDEGGQAVSAPVQVPQPPLAAIIAWTMAQRLVRMEEDMYEIQGALGEQREVLDSMAHVFSRFSTWMVVGLSQMMSQAGVRYTSYADFQIPYVRRNRCRTSDASTSTSQQDEQ